MTKATDGATETKQNWFTTEFTKGLLTYLVMLFCTRGLLSSD